MTEPPNRDMQRRPEKFKGFPRIGNEHTGYDVARIKREYLEHKMVEWADYCEARGYNPEASSNLAWRPWVREKKYRAACQAMAVELEKQTTNLGPNLMLAKIKAVKNVPEAASVMFQLVQFAIRIHHMEALQDEKVLKQVAHGERPFNSKDLKFSIDAQGLLFLSSALKQTSELLHKSLGIDPNGGMTPDRWQSLAESELAQIEGSAEVAKQTEDTPVTVEVIGGGKSMKEAMAAAFEKWMDKPGAADPLVAQSPSLPPEGDEALEENDVHDGSDE